MFTLSTCGGAVPKVHPATRPVEPEDPMNLHAVEIPGDTDLMLRVLVEEYARMGWNADAVMDLAVDPFYQGFHGLWRLHGEEELRRRVSAILARCGVVRVTTVHAKPPSDESDQLVQIALPGDTNGRNSDA